LKTFSCFLQFTISVNLPTIVGGWGWTDLTFKLPAARLKVLHIKVIEWSVCYWIHKNLQIYHMCAGGDPGIFNQGPCYVYNHFLLFLFKLTKPWKIIQGPCLITITTFKIKGQNVMISI
jgi:hypothetical protein